ncbi:uncharacterized protein LOC113779985 isoform X1 [Coffea eugenioides]|uniref:Uncharacterized protein isoform X1 n=1 Tax=Coffea arabica TaxID=13443 RepID=A0A6P6TPN8_COFAR|nr:uncharacterized protein LOC113779985 isoform X1 [Coffea eugenioides]
MKICGRRTQSFTPLTSTLMNCYINIPSKPLFDFSRKPSNPQLLFAAKRRWNRYDVLFRGIRRKNLGSWKMRNQTFVFSASEVGNGNADIVKKRKVVEHVCLLKAREDMSDEVEKDMLDYLYTTQYQMRGIVAISLGRISDQELGKYTHAVYIRFQKNEDLSKFYENPFYVGVLKDRVFPYCHDIVNVDYESEVEDDIMPIFRKGEEFNYGVEFVLLIAFDKNSLGGPAEDAMAALAELTAAFPSLIVQATKGSNFNLNNVEYTHGAVIRFRSSEACETFLKSSQYNDQVWGSKIQPISEKVISVHYSVDPVGTELM